MSDITDVIRDEMEVIVLTHPNDIAFCRIARGAIVNETTLPSGLVTPPRRMKIVGSKLVSAPEKKG